MIQLLGKREDNLSYLMMMEHNLALYSSNLILKTHVSSLLSSSVEQNEMLHNYLSHYLLMSLRKILLKNKHGKMRPTWSFFLSYY